MNDDGPSQAALLALMSLEEFPHLDTAAAIETGPFGLEQVDRDEIEAGLAELASLDPPRAGRKPGGGWFRLAS